jgi:hypothetical protein
MLSVRHPDFPEPNKMACVLCFIIELSNNVIMYKCDNAFCSAP